MKSTATFILLLFVISAGAVTNGDYDFVVVPHGTSISGLTPAGDVFSASNNVMTGTSNTFTNAVYIKTRLGVGTNNADVGGPSVLANVQGDVCADNAINIFGDTSGNSTPVFRLVGNHNKNSYPVDNSSTFGGFAFLRYGAANYLHVGGAANSLGYATNFWFQLTPDGVTAPSLGIGMSPSYNLDVNGSARFSNNITVGGTLSGNASGLTNIPVDAYCGVAFGDLGFVLAQEYAAGYKVAYSDTDALFSDSVFIKEAGNYSIALIWHSDSANSSKTANGVSYITSMPSNGAFNVYVTNSAWNIAIPDGAVNGMFSFYPRVFTIPANTMVGVYWQKNNNAGGASGNMYIHGIRAVKQ